MRRRFSEEVEGARFDFGPEGSKRKDRFGYFLFERNGTSIRVIMSGGVDQYPWDHVSVSLEQRCPTWAEMCFIKGLFFDETETVVQFHPPKKDYVNEHPYCLHLWRYINGEIPRPPKVMV